MTIRRDIQILRGVAVLYVVLFHANIGRFASGFLGVDMFFVISGFLMAQIYVDGHAVEFYMRRGRRLLPAYLATITATFLASMMITLPVERDQVATQTLFAAFSVANIYFFLHESYFSKAYFNPLLHLWSLGVEMQFYLIVPLLLSFVRRFRLLMPICLALSLLACLSAMQLSPKAAFFLTPQRIWEFLIGSALATRSTNPVAEAAGIRGGWASAARVVALGFILTAPFLPVDGQSTSLVDGHPALGAILVCLATAASLGLGLPTSLESSFLGRVFARIGDLSYSIYLVHFPILALFFYQPYLGTRLEPGSMKEIAILTLLIAASSVMLYSRVEKGGRFLFTPKRAGTAALATAATALAALTLGPLLDTAYPDRERKVFAAWTDRDAYRCGKVFRLRHPTEDFCEISREGAKKGSVMLVGNSHADALKASFAAVADAAGYRVFFAVPNDPLINRHFNADWLVREATAKRIETVFLHFSPLPGLVDVVESARRKLEDAGIRTVLLTPVPVYRDHVPAAIYGNLARAAPLPRQTSKAYYDQNERLFSYARNLRSTYFAYYDLAPSLCDIDCRIVDNDGRPLYFDGEHLTLTGARALESVLALALSGGADQALSSTSNAAFGGAISH